MQLLDDNLWMLFNAGKISAEEAIDKSKNPGAMVDRMQRAGLMVNRPDDLPGDDEPPPGGGPPAPPGGGGGGGAPAPAAGGPQNEAERQAQIEANRQRMARLNQKR